MRIIVFSDTHGNFHTMEEIFKRNDSADAFIFLGDGERELNRIRELYPRKRIYNVAGNCDYGSKALNWDMLMVNKVKIIFTHGHNDGVKFSFDMIKEKAKKSEADIVLFGHTHCRYYSYENGLHILNPGSASQPRDFKPKSYAFIDITHAGIMCAHVDL